LKGYKITVTFPAEVLSFLETIAKKLTKVPIMDPRANPPKPLVNPETGAIMYMSNTGGMEELIHSSILTALLPMLYQHEAFTAERGKIQEFHENYGNYLAKMINQFLLSKAGVTGDINNRRNK
jgi:hypothetical protein